MPRVNGRSPVSSPRRTPGSKEDFGLAELKNRPGRAFLVTKKTAKALVDEVLPDLMGWSPKLLRQDSKGFYQSPKTGEALLELRFPGPTKGGYDTFVRAFVDPRSKELWLAKPEDITGAGVGVDWGMELTPEAVAQVRAVSIKLPKPAPEDGFDDIL